MLARLTVVGRQRVNKVNDPAAGSGSLLLKFAKVLGPENVDRFVGQEINLITRFFAVVQNKLHYAAHGHTTVEVIASRADATKPNMQLTSFPRARVRKADVEVAKKYLTETVLKKLNTLVPAYFDATEFLAPNHEPIYMQDFGLILVVSLAAIQGGGP